MQSPEEVSDEEIQPPEAGESPYNPELPVELESSSGRRRINVRSLRAVFRELEGATVLLEWHALGIGFPVPGLSA